MIAGFLGVITEIAANSNLGGVFAMMHGRPFWYGPYFPVYFILSALITGCAFIIFFVLLAYKINRCNIDHPTPQGFGVSGKACHAFAGHCDGFYHLENVDDIGQRSVRSSGNERIIG